jgi:thiol:disulfide interchange protein DsbD
MDSTLERLVADSPILAVLVAFWAGAFASLSSCTIVRVPVVLSYVAGAADSKRRAVIVTTLFIAGLIASYTAVGIFFGLLGNLVHVYIEANKYVIWTLAMLLIGYGMLVAGLFDFKFLHPRLDVKEKFWRMTYVGAFVFGIFFALVEIPACPCCRSALLVMAGIVVVGNLSPYAIIMFLSFALGQSFPVLAVALSTSLIKTDVIMWLAAKIRHIEEYIQMLAGNVMIAFGIYLAAIA